MKFKSILYVLLLASLIAGCGNKYHYKIPESALSHSINNPTSDAVSVSEWRELLANVMPKISGKPDINKQAHLSTAALALINKSTNLINTGQRNVGIRIGIKGALLNQAAHDFSNINVFRDKLGFSQNNIDQSLINLNAVVKLEKLTRKFSEVAYQKSITPESLKPKIHSYDALNTYLTDVINGGNLTRYWCKKSQIARSELFSPRSYKILSEKSKDYYVQNSYYHSYNVRIESSNKGGMPIVKTWSFSMSYNEPLVNPGKIDWCIFGIGDSL